MPGSTVAYDDILQQEGLEVVAEHGFKLGFGDLAGFGDFQECEHIGFAQQVGRLFDDLTLLRQLQDADYE